MAINYKKLFHMLIEKEISTTQLIQKAGLSANIITKLKRNHYVSLDTIEKICMVLDCTVDDVLEFTKETKNEDKRL